MKVKVNVVYWWNENVRGEHKYSENNLSTTDFIWTGPRSDPSFVAEVFFYLDWPAVEPIFRRWGSFLSELARGRTRLSSLWFSFIWTGPR
jgi:hypothetical protein